MYDLPRFEGTETAMDADDTAICTASRDEGLIVYRLQSHLDRILDWSSKWRLKINESKCVAIRFTNRTRPPPDNIRVNDFRLPWSQSVMYLGIRLDSRLTLKKHISNSIEKFTTARSALYTLLCPKNKLSLKIKILLYFAFLRPILTYGALTISSVAKSNFRRLEVLQNRVLRLITGATP